MDEPGRCGLGACTCGYGFDGSEGVVWVLEGVEREGVVDIEVEMEGLRRGNRRIKEAIERERKT